MVHCVYISLVIRSLVLYVHIA